eukprot:m51a1_g5657 hypothetical protein (877) ;mRNA; f:885861-891212
MPQKLGYKVVFFTSEDPDAPASELDCPGDDVPGAPASKTGWCASWPQCLVLQLDRFSMVERMKLLSHQWKIASRVELFVAGPPPPLTLVPDADNAGDDPPSWLSASFTRLGHFGLSPNEKTGFKARELKSVHIEQQALFVKIVLHKCYQNQPNVYSQVGVVAISLFGEPLGADAQAAQAPSQLLPTRQPARQAAMDAAIAAEIDRLKLEKERAVREDDFDRAELVRQIIEDLKTSARAIAEREGAKSRAAAAEDYSLASKIKAEIERLRIYAMSQAQEGLASQPEDEVIPTQRKKIQQLQRSEPSPPPGPSEDQQQQQQQFQAPAQRQQRQRSAKPLHYDDEPISPRYDDDPSVEVPVASKPLPPVGQQTRDVPVEQQGGAQQSRALPVTRDPFAKRRGARQAKQQQQQERVEEPEEQDQARPEAVLHTFAVDTRPLPALMKKQAAAAAEGSAVPATEEATPDGGDKVVKPPTPMSLAQRAATDQAINVFGEELTQMTFSSNRVHRETAYHQIAAKLKEGTLNDTTRAFAAALQVLQRGLSDNNPGVYMAAVSALCALILDAKYAPTKQTALHSLNTFSAALIVKLGDGNQKVRDTSSSALISLAKSPLGLPGVVSAALSKPVRGSVNWRLLSGRLNVLAMLILEFPEIALFSGNDDVAVAKFAASALDNGNVDVRAAALKVLGEFHKVAPARTKQVILDTNPSQLSGVKEEDDDEPDDKIVGDVSDNDDKAARDKELHDAASPSASVDDQVDSKTLSLDLSEIKGDHFKDSNFDGTSVLEMVDEDLTATTPDEQEKCQFCGERIDDPQKIEHHYGYECRVLGECHLCGQVIEVPCAVEHLLTECEKGSKCRQCTTCRRVFSADTIKKHMAKCKGL